MVESAIVLPINMLRNLGGLAPSTPLSAEGKDCLDNRALCGVKGLAPASYDASGRLEGFL